MKNFVIFSHFTIPCPISLIAGTTLESSSQCLYLEKILLFFAFYLSWRRNKRALSESYRFMGVIYKSKKLFLAKVPLSNQFNFKRSLELWQMPLKVTGSIYRILKNQKTISYAKRSMIKQLAWLI